MACIVACSSDDETEPEPGFTDPTVTTLAVTDIAPGPAQNGDNNMEFQTTVSCSRLTLESSSTNAGTVSGGGLYEEGSIVEIVAEPGGGMM